MVIVTRGIEQRFISAYHGGIKSSFTMPQKNIKIYRTFRNTPTQKNSITQITKMNLRFTYLSTNIFFKISSDFLINYFSIPSSNNNLFNFQILGIFRFYYISLLSNRLYLTEKCCKIIFQNLLPITMSKNSNLFINGVARSYKEIENTFYIFKMYIQFNRTLIIFKTSNISKITIRDMQSLSTSCHEFNKASSDIPEKLLKLKLLDVNQVLLGRIF